MENLNLLVENKNIAIEIGHNLASSDELQNKLKKIIIDP